MEPAIEKMIKLYDLDQIKANFKKITSIEDFESMPFKANCSAVNIQNVGVIGVLFTLYNISSIVVIILLIAVFLFFYLTVKKYISHR